MIERCSIEKDGEFFDFDDTLVLNKEIKTLDLIGVASTFSYSATMQPTNNNKRLLGIENWDADLIIFRDFPVKIHLSTYTVNASLKVENYTEFDIGFSIFTDGFDFLNDLTGKLRDQQFKNYPLGTAASRRTNTTGYVDFLINNGNNKFTFSTFADSIVTAIYAKDLIADILTSKGIKLTGDILNDWRYNHLFVTNDSIYIEYDDQYIDDHTFFVGKIGNQVIAGPTVITFTNESGVFFDNPNWWDGASSFTPDMQRLLAWEANISFGGAAAYTLEIIDDLGTVIDTFVTPVAASVSWSSLSTFSAFPRAYSLRVTPPFGGLVLAQSTLKFYTFNEAYLNQILTRGTIAEMLPRFILPEMETKDFVTQIFSIFNPIVQFNPVTRILTVDLFENILNKPEEDWSDYIDSYELDFIEMLGDGYGKRTFLKYDDGDEQFIEDYNKRQPVPYGSGVLEIDNNYIEDSGDLLEIDFPPTTHELNNELRAYLPVMAYFDANNVESKFSNRLLLGVVNYSVSKFSSLPDILGITAMPYGWFTKPGVGKQVDELKYSLAFDNPDIAGFDQITLIDSYYGTFERVINKPILGKFNMLLPSKEFINFDASTPKRIRTKEFNSLFFCRKIEGWDGSGNVCLVELVKL